MAIIIKGSVNGTTSEAPKAPEVPVKKEKPVEQRKMRDTLRLDDNQPKYVRSTARQYRNMNESYLIVDGKEKKIGRQSKYLVDMLTIEE